MSIGIHDIFNIRHSRGNERFLLREFTNVRLLID